MTGQQPVYLTICPDCGLELGVTQDKFNRTGLDANVWRLSVHKGVNGRPRCTAARMEVHPNNIWRNDRRDRGRIRPRVPA
jgi:hypothetical protein